MELDNASSFECTAEAYIRLNRGLSCMSCSTASTVSIELNAGNTSDRRKTEDVQKIVKSAVKRAKSSSNAAGVTPSHAQQEVSAAAQSDQADQVQDEATTHAQHKEDKTKRKRKRASEPQPLPEAEAADAAQEVDTEAGKEADTEASTPAGTVTLLVLPCMK